MNALLEPRKQKKGTPPSLSALLERSIFTPNYVGLWFGSLRIAEVKIKAHTNLIR